MSSATHPLRGPFRLAVATTALTILVILKGAMVTSTGSGLAFLDWPFSDGELFPKRSYETLAGFFEHFHRVAAALVGLMAIALAVWLFLLPAADRAQRRLAVAAVVLVSVQGVVGGVGVLRGLPVLTSATHGTLAQLTLALFGVLAWRLSARWAATQPVPDAPPGAGRKLAVAAIVLLVVQAVLGAIARHGNVPNAPQHALWTHVGNALIVFLVVGIAASVAVAKVGTAPGVRVLARILGTMLLLQIVLGFTALLVRTSKSPENISRLFTASLISTHVLIGSLMTLTASLLAAQVFRATRPAGAVAAGP